MLFVVLGVAAPAIAQPEPQRQRVDEQMQSRYDIGVMERVLEQAVQHGAQLVGRMMQSISPNLMLFTGTARARGFRLDGYGVFFDVEVPALRPSLAWSLNVMNQQDLGVTSSLRSLKQRVQTIADGRARTDLEQIIKQLEMHVAPASSVVAAQGPSEPGAEAEPEPAPRPAVVEDPNRTYTEEVKNALIGAMLNYSGPLSIGPEEWLTVAARDNEDRLSPSDMYDVSTITLRIRGADLAAFRAGRIDGEEARKRVEIREF
jgi:hypothetical protein